MALEIGGRADKIGNQYENFVLGKQLLRLAEMRINSVEVEPLGNEGRGVEYIIEMPDGTRVYYQCKAANNSSGYWSVAALAQHHVFENAKAHIQRSENNEYHFISPLPYRELDELCDRARRNHSPDAFIDYQVTNDVQRALLRDIEKQLNLSCKIQAERSQLVYILSRCYFEQVNRTLSSIEDAENLTSATFCGNAQAARILLENYVNDRGCFGKVLSPHDIASFMAQNGYPLRDYGRDANVLQQIQVVNSDYWDTLTPINDVLLPRDSANMAIQYLQSGTSVILHGKAGSGKSGCAELISNRLLEMGIPFLRLKLDKRPPQNTAEQYGKTLGLPDSPVRCLERIAGKQNCVLILDQLDALRWTVVHSPTALAVCKEMVSQVGLANREHHAHISIVFVVRSFDYEHEPHIRKLFSEDPAYGINWEQIEVGLFSNDEVASIVGARYPTLSAKTKHLLRTPSSLFVWQQLEESQQVQTITSANSLMEHWWRQILSRCEEKSISIAEMDRFVQKIACDMGTGGRFFLPRRLMAGDEKFISALISEGLLLDSPSKVAFAHQTYLDYFVVNYQLSQVLSGTPLVTILGARDTQTPNLRYRLMALLQEMCSEDDALFVGQSEETLRSDNVRFYYQCVVFDALSQQTEPSEKLCKFAEKWLNHPDWHDYCYRIVYLGNVPYIRHLLALKRGDFLSDENLSLLRSINEKAPDYLAEILEPLCFQNEQTDRKIFDCLCSDVDYDSNAMYQLRHHLLQKHPEFFSTAWMSYYRLSPQNAARFADYLCLTLDHISSGSGMDHIYLPEDETLTAFAKENCELIANLLLPKLRQCTAGMAATASECRYQSDYSRWNAEDYSSKTPRDIIRVASIAIRELALQNPEKFLKICLREDLSEALVGNELILNGLECLSAGYADTVISWITESFPKHLFDYTGAPRDYLAPAKGILAQFTPFCSEAVFLKLEQRVLRWTERSSWMRMIYKQRSEIRAEYKTPVYYAYWGFMQKELLPAMSQERLSVKSKELQMVLDRNPWIKTPNYRSSLSCGMAKNVVSPISGHTDKLSDKTWLEIIHIPLGKISKHSIREIGNVYIEANHPQFAGDLERQAKKQPARFAELSLHFPERCYPGYISAVLRAQEKREEHGPCAEAELVSRVIHKYSGADHGKMLGIIADIVESRAEEEWPEDILALIAQIAQMPIDKSRVDQYSSRRENSAHVLYDELFNMPQSRSIRAIARLITTHPDLFVQYRGIISALAASTHPFILLALSECAVACNRIEPEYSMALFKQLLSTDVRFLIANHAWDFIYNDYQNDPCFYRSRLMDAIQSGYDDLEKDAAAMLCAISIYTGDEDARREIFCHHFTAELASKVCTEASYHFEDECHRDFCKEIILHMAKTYAMNDYTLRQEFFEKSIRIERDKEFLLELAHTSATPGIPVELLKFLCDTEENIFDFAEIICAAVRQATNLSGDKIAWIHADAIVRCISHLYDVTKDCPEKLTVCLDAWDALFQNHFRNIQNLSTLLDNMN